MDQEQERNHRLMKDQASVEAITLEVEAKLAATQAMFTALGASPDDFLEQCRDQMTSKIYADLKESIESTLGQWEEKYLDQNDPARAQKFSELKTARQSTAKNKFV